MYSYPNTTLIAAAPLEAKKPTPTPKNIPVVSPTVNFTRLDDQTFDALNPLKIENSPVADEFATPGTLISRTMSFIFPLSGGVLFVMLVIASFEILGNAATQKSKQAGRDRINTVIAASIALFCIYWAAQILQHITGIKMVG